MSTQTIPSEVTGFRATASGSAAYGDTSDVALHLGVEPANLMAVTRELTTRLGADVVVNGDGWNSWAEPVGTDANNATTLHVLARIDATVHDEAAVYAVVETLHRQRLAAISTDVRRTLAAVSCWDYWGEEAGGASWSALPDGTVTHTRYLPILGVAGAITGRTYQAHDTGERWNGSRVLAFTEREIRSLIEHGDGEDGNGYGLAIEIGCVVDRASASEVEPVPTIQHEGQTLYVPAGCIWEPAP